MRTFEERAKERRDRFGDLCYEAWMSNKDPDGVNGDAFDDCYYRLGMEPEDISLRDCYEG